MIFFDWFRILKQSLFMLILLEINLLFFYPLFLKLFLPNINSYIGGFVVDVLFLVLLHFLVFVISTVLVGIQMSKKVLMVSLSFSVSYIFLFNSLYSLYKTFLPQLAWSLMTPAILGILWRMVNELILLFLLLVVLEYLTSFIWKPKSI